MKSAKLLSLSMCAVLGAASVAEAKWVAFRMWSEGEPRELSVPADGSASVPFLCASEVFDQVVGLALKSVSFDWAVTEIRWDRKAGPLEGALVFSSADDGHELFRAPVGEMRRFATQRVALPCDLGILRAMRRPATVRWQVAKGRLLALKLNFGVRTPRTNGLEHVTVLRLEFDDNAKRLSFEPSVKIDDNAFVTVDGAGDLVYKGRKLRLSGVDVSQPTSHEEAETIVRRLKAMNVNGVRVFSRNWYAKDATNATPEYAETELIDAYDYFIALLRKNNVFVHCTSVSSGYPPMDARFAEMKRNVFWLLPEGHARLKAHALRFANHVNPYLGRRNGELSVFATYELFNEDTFIADLLQKDAHGYGGKMSGWTPEQRRRFDERWWDWLEKRYGKREERPFGPLFGDEEACPEEHRSDALQFLQHLQGSVNDDICAALRAAMPKGVGLNVAPILHGTHGYVNMNAQYVHQRGDGVGIGLYQSPYTTKRDAPFFPYAPFVTHRPYFWNLNMQTVENKFFMIYEHHPHGPYKYRCEWLPVLYATGAGLGWDALYYYNFSKNSASIQGDADLAYAGTAVPEPTPGTRAGYCRYFMGAVDEILMGGLVVCGQAFVNGIAKNVEKTVVSYGPKAYADPLWRSYSRGEKSTKFDQNEIAELTGGGVEEYLTMPNMYRKLMQNSVRRQLTLNFDPNQEAPLKITGPFEYVERLSDDRGRLEPSPDITWDTPNSRLVIDNRTAAIAVGVLEAKLAFKNGVTFRQARKLPFAFFGAATRDGRGFAESRDIVLNVSSDAENTGYRLNPEKMTKGPLALIPAIESKGRAPVRVTRPAGKVKVPGGACTVERYNFAGYCYRSERSENGTFVIADGEPVFVVRVTR